MDSVGNLFVADQGSSYIRYVTRFGVVTTVAGNGSSGWADGQGTSAAFSSPYSVATDAFGNVFVGDLNNYRVRKINSTGYVSTFAGNGSNTNADGMGTAAAFRSPTGVVCDGMGNVYVSDASRHERRATCFFRFLIGFRTPPRGRILRSSSAPSPLLAGRIHADAGIVFVLHVYGTCERWPS